MKRIFITGEKGFIARNLIERMKRFNNMSFVAGDKNITESSFIEHSPGEPCVHLNHLYDWKEFFYKNKIDVIIHNAAAVGTDVVALDPTNATLTNVAGTQLT